MVEHWDPERCTQCGGACCWPYYPQVIARFVPDRMSFEEYVEMLHPDSDRYGVIPLFDPVAVHAEGDNTARLYAEAFGLDVRACEFLGPQGCIVPWELRPAHCREFRCQAWIDEEASRLDRAA